jgi:TRAP-type C4-dicarboxylate transport system substrate-binding protein
MSRRSKPGFVAALLGLVICASSPAQEQVVKFASIAPEGSTWGKVMREYDAAVRKESGGRLGFKMYLGGSQGEDMDVIRKMRLGQLHSAGLTGVGLGEIASRARIMDSPFLFESYAEVDHIYETFDKEFSKAFEDRGYVLLGWAEVGFAYVFTNTPVRQLADMRGVKMWMWEGDPVAEAAFKTLGVNPIPLSVVDVLTSLQTGLINGAYASPLATIALSWYSRVKYMMSVPLADASGAVVISKKRFDALPADLQEILLRNGRKYMGELTRKSREENAAAIGTLKKNGIQIMEVKDPGILADFVASGKKARQSLVGKLYEADFLQRVEQAVADVRSGKDTR